MVHSPLSNSNIHLLGKIIFSIQSTSGSPGWVEVLWNDFNCFTFSTYVSIFFCDILEYVNFSQFRIKRFPRNCILLLSESVQPSSLLPVFPDCLCGGRSHYAFPASLSKDGQPRFSNDSPATPACWGLGTTTVQSEVGEPGPPWFYLIVLDWQEIVLNIWFSWVP